MRYITTRQLFKLEVAETETPASAIELLENGSLKYSVRSTAGGRCWFAKGFVFNLDIDWLIDSGAAPNVLDIGAYKSIPEHHRPTLEPTSASFQSADGNTLSVYGEADIPVCFGTTTLLVRCVVAHLGNLQAIVGIHFLEENRCIVDLENGRISSPTFEITLYKLSRKESLDCATILLFESISFRQGMKWWPWRTSMKGFVLSILS